MSDRPLSPETEREIEEAAKDAGSRCFHVSQHDDRFLLACPVCVQASMISLVRRAEDRARENERLRERGTLPRLR